MSSHTPWTRIPPLIDWSKVGDGSVFNRLPVDESGLSDVKQGYGRSIEYTLRSLFSFVEHYGRKNLVLVVLGDHQPATVVTGYGRQSRRPDLGHRPRPGGDAPDRRVGLGGRHAPRSRRRRSGR